MAGDAVEIGRRVLLAEAEALKAQAAMLDAAFAEAVRILTQTQGKIVCSGMGKSGHVARKIAATFASTGAPAMFVHPAEASHGDLGMIGQKDAILALSRSGEARELTDLVLYAKTFGIPLIAITAFPASALGRAAQVVLAIPQIEEASESVDAPTTSTTLQMALGDALAVSLLEQRGFSALDFRTFHPGGKLGAMLRTAADVMHTGEELPLVAETAPMSEALLTMTSKAFGIVGVTDAEGRLTGVVTDGDLRRHISGLLDRRVEEVMTRRPKTISAGLMASEALERMSRPAPPVTALFVVDEAGRPVGVVHVHDLIRLGLS